MPAGNTFNINEYAAADSFHFSEEICEQAPNLYTGNLNVYSLFTNIPLNDIIILALIVGTVIIIGIHLVLLCMILQIAWKLLSCFESCVLEPVF